MSVSLRYNGRLPGVVVNTALPLQPAPLRLDVAGFVGFAERGPLDTPVAIEDIGQYQAVFGDDLPVAREGGKPIYAALPSAVRAFFDNGGRRCYAVRVAGADADQARFRLPGMVALSGETLAPATVEAAWVGRWSDQLALWTQLLVRPVRLAPNLAPLAEDSSTRTLVLELPRATAVAPGDLLRLTFDNGLFAFFSVAATTTLGRLRGIGQGVPVAVQGQTSALWLFRRTLPRTPPITGVESLGASIENIGIDSATALVQQPAGYDLIIPADTNMKIGDLLRITCAGGQVLLFPVARIGKLRVSCDDPFWLSNEAVPAAAPSKVELLRFALRVRQGETIRERFEELPFNPGPNDQAQKSNDQIPSWTQRMCAWPPDDTFYVEASTLLNDRSALLRVPPNADTLRYLPIGIPLLPAPDAYTGPYALGNDGLATFAPRELFLDARLRDFGPRTIMAEAERLLYLSDQPTHLRALHSLIPVEEVALIAIPDLAQRGWPAITIAPPIDPPPPPPPAPAPPDWSSFQDCARPVPAAISADAVVHEFYGNLLPLIAGDTAPALDANARALLSDTYREQIAQIALPTVLGVDELALGFVVSLPPCATDDEQTTSVLGVLTLANGVELRTDFGMVRQDTSWKIDSIKSRIARTVPSEAQRRLAQLPLLLPPAEYVAPPTNGSADHMLALVGVQAALITLCAARGDMTATLSLPDFFAQREAADWRPQLDAAVGLPTDVPLSYAAVYHPWLQQPELATPELAPLRAVPPEGAICGTIAAREHDRGVWVAPAGIALRGTVGLTPALTDDAAGTLFDAPTQINIVRQQPGRYLAISAHTLSATRMYWQLAVRRLLILLRKAALRRGAQYVFETNNERFQRQVRGSFERMLARLAQQGALAAYQVIADSSLNTPNDRDNGRFLVALKIAPISPIEFITVVLLRSGEDVLDVLER